jgi:hypothetical protein
METAIGYRIYEGTDERCTVGNQIIVFATNGATMTTIVAQHATDAVAVEFGTVNQEICRERSAQDFENDIGG